MFVLVLGLSFLGEGLEAWVSGGIEGEDLDGVAGSKPGKLNAHS